MSKLLKWTAALLMGGVVLSGAVLPLEAAAIDPADSLLVDEADLLTDAQETELSEEIVEMAGYIDMNILVFVSGHYESEGWTQMYCEELCEEYFGLEEDSVVLYMDLSGHDDPSYSPYDFFYTRNLARFYYTDDAYGGSNRVQEIFGYLNPYLPRCEEDVYGAIGEFLDQLEWYYDLGPDYDYYYYVPDLEQYVTLSSDNVQEYSDSAPKSWGLAILIGIVGSLIITLIVFLSIKSHYRFKSAPSSLQYLNFEGAKFGPPSDVFIRKYQTRRKIERSSSSSGGGGGHSGTSSGGGGGGNHR
ncbi:MAG: hypothetical protein IJ496_00135 [Ruminococcus sp.]|nr:hypothetical protein [Ruminococcus sp.]